MEVWQRFSADGQLARAALKRGALQKPSEFAPLLRLVGKVRPRTVVEIGTATGGAMYALARRAHSQARLVTVDVEERSSNAQPLPTQTFLAVKGRSQDPATVEQVRDAVDGQIDLLFIDGDHALGAVRGDVELYGPLVCERGLVVLHDILPQPARPAYQVHELWNELRHRYAVIEFVSPAEDWGWGQWGGLGVYCPSNVY